MSSNFPNVGEISIPSSASKGSCSIALLFLVGQTFTAVSLERKQIVVVERVVVVELVEMKNSFPFLPLSLSFISNSRAVVRNIQIINTNIRTRKVEEKGNCFSSRQARPPPPSPPRQSASAP